MKAVKAFFGLTFIILAAISVSAQYSQKAFADGELLVKFKDGTASAFASRANSEVGALVLEEFADLKWQRVKLPETVSVDEAMAVYAAMPNVEYVQPNFYYHLLATPNDPQYATGMYGMTKISAPSAWDLTTGSSDVVVADIDTGLTYTHEDLAANSWKNLNELNGITNVDDDGNGFVDDIYGWDFFYNDSNPIDDAGGHGTHTAGTIGAVGNNGIGVVGVNWNVKIMAVKIYSPIGTNSTSAMLINAYNYIRMMKNRGVNIRVTNNSYGGCGEACGYDQATKDALDAMGEAGILNVFAAGNNNQNIDSFPYPSPQAPGYPARYTSPSILSVAASTSSDARAGFSNWGTTSVDLAAPGVSILSTVPSGYSSAWSGTSMASPHVAGAAALLSAYNPNLSAASLKATLMNTVDPLAAWTTLVKTGGRLNVDRALRNQTVCNFNLSSTSLYTGNDGSNGSVNVTAPANCDYSIRSNAVWITVTTPNVGSGNGTVNFTVAPNPFIDGRRFGTITIADRTFTIAQGTPFTLHGPLIDFDGDGRTDLAAIQDNGGTMLWHIQQSTLSYTASNFGVFNDDVALPEDFDGDYRTDIAVWRNSTGTFYVFQSLTNTVQTFQFGLPGDNPNITQDFDGDRRADFAVTRAQGGSLVWYIYSVNNGFRALQFGNATDRPIRGDYDGDGKFDLAIYRPSTGSPANTFFIQRSMDNAWIVQQFGISTTDKVVPGDYDADGKTDIAVWRTTDGIWHYLKSSNGSYNAFAFGQSGDLPTPGDYDGDTRTDFSVWRPGQSPSEAGVYYVQRSTAGFAAFGWGNSTMKIPANSMQSP